jgi:hypothetical protein
MRWAGYVARIGEDRGVHKVLVGKPEGKRPLGRPRHRWEDNIKMDLMICYKFMTFQVNVTPPFSGYGDRSGISLRSVDEFLLN